MSSRRSHQNSHHGCQQCKDARKKCDEQQPECGRCQSKNHRCRYRHLLSSYNAFQTKTKTNAIPCSPNDAELGSSSKSRLISPPLTNCASILAGHNESLYLTHHYFTVISPSAARAQPHLENFHGWASAVQQHWPMFEFVQYGICALSSLHLACKADEPEARVAHLANGMKFQNAGVAHFRNVLSSDGDLSSSLLEACITFSGILSLCAFSSASASRSSTRLTNRKLAINPIFDIIQAMFLIRGVKTLNRLHESKKGSSFSTRQRCVGLSKFLRQRWEDNHGHHHLATLSGISDGEASLDMLTEYIQCTMSLPGAAADMQQNSCQEILQEDHIKDIYIATIIQLKPSIRCYGLWPGIARFVYRFASITHTGFLALLEQQQPVALIILAHYAVCLYALRQYWWTGSLGRDIVVAVVDELFTREDSLQDDMPWSQLMAWPMREVRVEMKIRKSL